MASCAPPRPCSTLGPVRTPAGSRRITIPSRSGRVFYGASGVAHDEGLTRLLLERGADPNDGETPYHAPESHDMGVLRALVESGKLDELSVTTMLLRKTDWHHYEGIRFLLEHGADPNRLTPWRKTALHN